MSNEQRHTKPKYWKKNTEKMTCQISADARFPLTFGTDVLELDTFPNVWVSKA